MEYETSKTEFYEPVRTLYRMQTILLLLLHVTTDKLSSHHTTPHGIPKKLRQPSVQVNQIVSFLPLPLLPFIHPPARQLTLQDVCERVGVFADHPVCQLLGGVVAEETRRRLGHHGAHRLA